MKEALIGLYEKAVELSGNMPEEWIVGIMVAPAVLIGLYWYLSGIIGVAKAAERGEIDCVIVWWW